MPAAVAMAKRSVIVIDNSILLETISATVTIIENTT